MTAEYVPKGTETCQGPERARDLRRCTLREGRELGEYQIIAEPDLINNGLAGVSVNQVHLDRCARRTASHNAGAPEVG